MSIKLKAARVNADMTQEEVIEELNKRTGSRIAKSTLISWEQYKTFPLAPQFKALCDIYGTNMDDIFIPSSLP